jgi:hypothetical protein
LPESECDPQRADDLIQNDIEATQCAPSQWKKNAWHVCVRLPEERSSVVPGKRSFARVPESHCQFLDRAQDTNSSDYDPIGNSVGRRALQEILLEGLAECTQHVLIKYTNEVYL